MQFLNRIAESDLLWRFALAALILSLTPLWAILYPIFLCDPRSFWQVFNIVPEYDGRAGFLRWLMMPDHR